MGQTTGRQQTDEQRQRSLSILWLTPDKPANISTGRQRIAAHLRDRGHAVTQTAGRRDCFRELSAGYDVVVTTTAWGGVVGPLAQRTGTAHVVDYVDPVRQLYRAGTFPNALAAQTLRTAAMRTADGVVFVYDGERSRVRTHTDTYRQTTLGVDYDRFADPAPAVEDAAHARLSSQGISGDFAIYIGGLEPIYDIERMLAGFAATDALLVIAGTGSKQAAVEQAAVENENIHFLGLVDHDIVPGLLAQAQAGVSLVDDPHTVKTLEYAAAGLPILAAGERTAYGLPTSPAIEYTERRAELADSIRAVMRKMGDSPELAEWAKAHDYERVVDDYEQMLQRVVTP